MSVTKYRPRALHLGRRADGYILQLADPQVLEWTLAAVRGAAPRGRPRPQRRLRLRCRPPPTSEQPRPPAEQLRWFGGIVGDHVADMVRRYGEDESKVPKVLIDYIKGRDGYDYDRRRQGREPVDRLSVPDQMRRQIYAFWRRSDDRVEKLRRAQATWEWTSSGVYLMHDDQEGTASRLRGVDRPSRVLSRV